MEAAREEISAGGLGELPVYLGDDAILIESRSARDKQMAEMPDDLAQDILNRAKALVFAVWQGQGIASTEQIAEFYQVSSSTILSAARVKGYREELDSDGLKVLRGKLLKDVKPIIGLTSDTPQALSWTPCAALRLGMFLRDSPVAKQVRNLLIEMAARGLAQNPSERELQLQVELQRLRQQYQDTGWQIVSATSPAMLAFIRGEAPLVRIEIQYIERHTGAPIGTTTNYRRLRQLVEDVGLNPDSDADKAWVEDILKRELGMDFDTGEGLGRGFFVTKPSVIPEDQYERCLYTVAVDVYGKFQLSQWQYSQQLLPEYLKEKGLLPGTDLE